MMRSLYSWYEKNQRTLAFRGQTDPYRIWISEVMLQQTRVEAMLPLYEKFVARFPDVESLASAEMEEVLDAWRGLGYYSRARNLHRGARFVQHDRAGAFPRTTADLIQVPGIGPYTSAAIASIAFGEAAAVVDGNVRRVITRLLGRKVPGRETQEQADRLMSLRGKTSPALHNQAMMELGSLVCTPRSPECGACPLADSCQSARIGVPFAESLTKSERKPPIDVTMEVFVIADGRRIWLLSDAGAAFLAGQWFFPVRFTKSPPELEGTPGRFPRGGPRNQAIPHSITKYRLELVPVRVTANGFRPQSNERMSWKCVSSADARRLVVSSAGSKVLRSFDP